MPCPHINLVLPTLLLPFKVFLLVFGVFFAMVTFLRFEILAIIPWENQFLLPAND